MDVYYFIFSMGVDFFVLLVISVIIALFLALYFGRKKKISAKLSLEFTKKLKYIENDTISNKEKVVVLDILYHQILKTLGYTGSFGEILKGKPKEISNINEIWRLHKLRNTLVHELGSHDDETLQKDIKKYSSQIKSLLKDITK